MRPLAAASPASPAPARRRRRRRRAPLLFVAPFFVLFLGVQIVPIAYGAWQSLFRTKTSGLGFGTPTVSFVWLDNYRRVFDDPAVRAGVGRVLLFGAIQVPVMLGFALLIALLLDGARVRFAR